MGGSRRRLKLNAPKVKVGIRKKTGKSRTPLEVSEGKPDIQKRLNSSISWEEDKNLGANYAKNKLILDANQGFGRNSRAVQLKSKEEREAVGEGTFSDDDELRAGCNQERKTGKAAPPRLTSHQREIIDRLVKAHGEDVQAMVLDIKLNSMQHSAGQLRKLIAAAEFWRPNSRHDFRAPRKPPKKIY